MAGLGILIRLVVELDVNEIFRLVARTGWYFALLLLVYGGCQAAWAAALWLCQPQVQMVPYREVLGIRMSAEAVRLLTLRLLHVPFAFVNWVSGVSTVRPWTFVWTTVIGLVPGAVVLVGLGAGLPSLSDLREQGVISLISPVLFVALLAMALIPWIIRGSFSGSVGVRRSTRSSTAVRRLMDERR